MLAFASWKICVCELAKDKNCGAVINERRVAFIGERSQIEISMFDPDLSIPFFILSGPMNTFEYG
jgi:hypothetical protein